MSTRFLDWDEIFLTALLFFVWNSEDLILGFPDNGQKCG